MRTAARLKGGFYPCPHDAVAFALQHLRPSPVGEFSILDPSAGRGAAIQQLAAGLGCPEERLYLVELEEERAAACRAALPMANVLAPASFFGTRIGGDAFALAWCNPPFDDELGGGRTERLFLSRATDLLCDRGVLAFVCPEHVVSREEIQKLLLVWFDSISVVPFPQECRRYREVIVFGVRRKSPCDPKRRRWRDVCGSPATYTLPTSVGPGRRWEKTDYTEPELVRSLAASPLQRYLKPPAKRGLARPPLQLGTGHLALLLASGFLDGLVQPPGEEPHVVRGCANKREEITAIEEDETRDAVTSKVTFTEKIVLSVRAIGTDGAIRTLKQE